VSQSARNIVADPAVKTTTLTDLAYARLEEMIATLLLAPGEFLSEQVLAETVGLGRTPIREALQRLAREGLVTILPRRGVQVAPIDAREQLLVVEVRRELERLISRSAAARATSEQRISFAAIADGLDRAGRANDALEFLRLDRELNLLMLDAAHNTFAVRTMQLLAGLSRRYWYQHHPSRGGRRSRGRGRCLGRAHGLRRRFHAGRAAAGRVKTAQAATARSRSMSSARVTSS
jgi:DNA-binding GntR family transcriptional regulator